MWVMGHRLIWRPFSRRVGAHNSVVGADQGFRAPSWDQESVRDSVHEDSTSARIAAGQLPRPSFRHPHDVTGQGITAAGLDQMPYDESYGQYRIRLVDGSLDDPAAVRLLADLFRGARYEYRERSPSRFPGQPAADDADDDAGADPEGD